MSKITGLSFETIENPYNNNLNRVDTGVLNTAGTIDLGAAGDSDNYINKQLSEEDLDEKKGIQGQDLENLWISSWIKSRSYLPGQRGFLIDGRSGLIECANLKVRGVGEIGGWNIDATRIYSDNNEIVLDSSNKKITVGSGGAVESSNYVSGYAGSGFHIDEDLAEFGNIACRGLIRTSCFQKDTASVMGGNWFCLDGDVLDVDMTANASTLTTKATTTFLVGDILRIKDGTDDEWLEVTAVNGAVYACDRDKKGDYDWLSDKYSEANRNTVGNMYAGGYIKRGQSFVSNGGILNSCKFFLSKQGLPTGNAVAKVYAHTGTFGVNGKPTGSALATSDNFDVSTLTTGWTLETFNFSGTNKVSSVYGTYYCIVIEYSGGNGSNLVSVGADTTSPTHGGNACSWLTSAGAWASASYDICFYVYADINPAWKKGATIVNYGQSGGGGVYMTASESNAPYLSVFTHAGSPWTDLTTRLRMGKLDGYLGYPVDGDKYGIGIGSSSGTNANLVFDPTNGIRLRQGTTDKIILDNSGNVTATGTINATAGKFGTATNYWNVGATGLTAVSASTDVIINYGKTDFGQDSTNGFILGYDYSASKSKFEIGSSATKLFKYDGTDFVLIGGDIKTNVTDNDRIELNQTTNRIEIYDDTNDLLGYFGHGGTGTLLYLDQPSGASGNAINLNNANSSESLKINDTHTTKAINAVIIQSASANASTMYLSNSANYRTLTIVGNSGSYPAQYISKSGNNITLYAVNTGANRAILASSNSNVGANTTGCAIQASQAGTSSIYGTNVAGCYCSKAGVWTDASSRCSKENFENIKVLDIVKTLDIMRYNYLGEKRQTKKQIAKYLKNTNQKESKINREYAQELKRLVPKHFSPMAEDFYKAFGVGDAKGISPKDLAGIALQGVKELIAKVEMLESKLKIKTNQ